MITPASILTAIKGAGIATKIGLGIGATAVVAGGSVGTVAVINHINQTPATQVVAKNAATDLLNEAIAAPKAKEETKKEEKPAASSSETKTETEAKPTTSSSNTQTAQKPSSSQTSTTTSKPSTTTTTKPAQTTSSTTTTTSTTKPTTSTSQTTQTTTQPAKKPDYNLNDKYVAGSSEYYFLTYHPEVEDTMKQCVVAEVKSFFGVAKFTGGTGDLWEGSHHAQYVAYAKSKGYDLAHCGGMGASTMTWQDAIDQGIALDEAKCKQYGLSCGRW